MKRLCLSLLLLTTCPVAVVFAQTPPSQGTITTQSAATSQSTATTQETTPPGDKAEPEVVLDRATSDIFPLSWLTPQVNAQADLLAPEERQRAQEVVALALKKYPSALLEANLKAVYVVGRLKYSGVSAGGTNSRSAVYVIGNSRLSPLQIENIIHAEFSSILLRNFAASLDSVAWQHLNPPGFAYRGNGVEAIKNNQASLKGNDALQQEGFLDEYAKASLEEDFNSFTGRLFTGDDSLWEAIEKSATIKAKAELVFAFYTKLDSSLTKEFFSSLRPLKPVNLEPIPPGLT